MSNIICDTEPAVVNSTEGNVRVAHVALDTFGHLALTHATIHYIPLTWSVSKLIWSGKVEEFCWWSGKILYTIYVF